MTVSNEYTSFASSLETSLGKLWKIGGLQLVMIFVGFMALFGANFVEPQLQYICIGIGVLCFAATMIVYWQTYISPVSKLKMELQSKKEFLDNMQETVGGLAEKSKELHVYIYDNASVIEGHLKKLEPHLPIVPLIGEQLAGYVSQATSISADVVNLSGETKRITGNAAKAIKDVDYAALEECLAELSALTERFRQNPS